MASKNTERYYGIQYLRGLAASLVIIYHSMAMSAVAPYFGRPVGDFGVDIFFVISGFVMWVTTDHKPRNVLSFWTARIFRVAPLYWLFTFSIVVASISLPSLFFSSRGFDVAFLMKSLLFVPSVNPDIGDITPVYTIGWTLIYEMFFYLVFGFCLFVKSRSRRILSLSFLFIAFVAFGATFKPDGPVLATYSNPIIFEFLAGAAIGYFKDDLLAAGPRKATALMLCSAAAFLTLDATHYPRVLVYGVPSAMLVASVVILERQISARVLESARLLGDASYSLYLSHPISQRIWYVAFVIAIGPIATNSQAALYFLGAVFVGILGGIACYYLVERPLLRTRAVGRDTVGLLRRAVT